MKTLVVSLVIFQSLYCFAQERHYGIGALVKMEFNAYSSNKQTESVKERYYTSAPALGLGGYGYAQMNKRWFVDLAVSASRANYNLNYTEGNAQFTSADIRLCAIDLGLNYILNPNSRGTQVYAFAGLQLLIRRCGEENFVNRILDNAYLPNIRLQMQTGLGCRLKTGDNHFIQIFSGLRFSGNQKVIYDTPINQWYIGSSIGFRINAKSRDRYLKCPAEF